MNDETREKLSRHLINTCIYAMKLYKRLTEKEEYIETMSILFTDVKGITNHFEFFPCEQTPDEPTVRFKERMSVQKIKEAKEATDAAYDAVKDTNGQGEEEAKASSTWDFPDTIDDRGWQE